jgi:membrane protein DedA with SNARE-associated domain
VTDQLLQFVNTGGSLALALILMASCLAVPVPSALVMMAVGSLVDQGEIEALPFFLAGLAGSVAGDQLGYLIGRTGRSRVRASAEHGWLAATLQKAERFETRWGDLGIFLSRWLLSPMGPWINLVAGMTGYSWARFSFFGLLGEAVWVAGYLALGVTFSRSVEMLSEVLGSLTWFIVSALVAGILGWKLLAVARTRKRRH